MLWLGGTLTAGPAEAGPAVVLYDGEWGLAGVWVGGGAGAEQCADCGGDWADGAVTDLLAVEFDYGLDVAERRG